jgi:hypothetical protein
MVLLRCWHIYARYVERSPILTSSVTAAGLMVSGDLTAQRLEFKRMKMDRVGQLQTTCRTDNGWIIDWRRTVVTSSWNAFVMAPTFFLWFRALDRRFPGSSIRCDQGSDQSCYNGPTVQHYLHSLHHVYETHMGEAAQRCNSC